MVSNKQLLQETLLFRSLSDNQLDLLEKQCTEFELKKDTVFINEGDKADACYVIKEGICQVFTINPNGEKIILARLEKGAHVGEQALLGESPGFRKASVVARSNAILIKISHEIFYNVIRNDKDLQEKLKRLGDKQLFSKLRAQSKNYDLSNKFRLELKGAKTRKYKSGDILFKEGDQAEGVYLIVSGQAEVYIKNKEGESEFVRTLEKGNIIGEYGVMQNRPRGATVQAAGELETLFLEAEAFRQRCQTNPALKDLTVALSQVYSIPNQGRVIQYTGEFFGLAAIISNFELYDGRHIFAARLIGTKITSVHDSGVSDGEIVSYIVENEVNREIIIHESKVVGVTDRSGWENINNVITMIFKETPVTLEQINYFREHGELILPIHIEIPKPIGADLSELICSCMFVERGTILEQINSGCTDIAAITKATGAGSVCGSCVPKTLEMLGRSVWQAVHIKSVQQLTGNIRSYELIPINAQQLSPFKAGQHVVIQANIDGNWVERSYTLTSSPAETSFYEIAVKREDKGLFSRWLFDNEHNTSLLRASRPQGEFILNLGSSNPVVCFMAGIGITPAVCFARSIVSHAARCTLHIYHCARSKSEFAYEEELLRLAEASNNILYVPRITSESGRITEKEIQTIVAQNTDALFFICGPDSFEDYIHNTLIKCGINTKNIQIERFVHAGGPQN